MPLSMVSLSRLVISFGDKVVTACHTERLRKVVAVGQTLGEEVNKDLRVRPGIQRVGERE